jgi:hypothetical protein
MFNFEIIHCTRGNCWEIFVSLGCLVDKQLAGSDFLVDLSAVCLELSDWKQ